MAWMIEEGKGWDFLTSFIEIDEESPVNGRYDIKFLNAMSLINT